MNPRQYLKMAAAALAAAALSIAQDHGQPGQADFRLMTENQLNQQKLTANNLMGKKIVDRNNRSIGEVKDIGLGSALESGPGQKTTRGRSTSTDRRESTGAGGMTGRAAGSQAGQIVLYVELDDELNIEGDGLAAIPASNVSFDRQNEQLQLRVARNEFTSQLRQSGSSATAQSTSQSTSSQASRTGEETLTPTGVVVVEQITLRPVDTESMIPLTQLPAEVRRGVQREAPGREIAEIDREESNGRVVYEVEFRDSGVNPRLHFDENGTLVTDAASAGDQAANFLAGTQVSDTPRAVQDVIRREAANGRVTDVDLERRTGQNIYEVEIQDSRGRYEIHMDVNGTILRHDRRIAP